MPFLLVTVSTVKLLPGVLDSSDGAEARLKIPNHLASPSLSLDDSSRVTGYTEGIHFAELVSTCPQKLKKTPSGMSLLFLVEACWKLLKVIEVRCSAQRLLRPF